MMKKVLITFLCSFLTGLSWGLAPADTNKTDASGKKQGLWKEKITGVDFVGNYVNDKKEGAWYGYSVNSSGTMMLAELITYAGNRKNGVSFSIDRNGHLTKEVYYINDTLNGTQKTYFPGTGKTESETNYRMGKLYGPKKVYNSEGKFVEEGNYINNNRHGVNRWFYSDGKINSEYNYNNGNLEGPVTGYSATGLKSSEGTYKNNEMEGKYVEYYDNGNIKRIGQYAKGKEEGTWKEFAEEGTLIKTVKYKEGKIIQ